jgi:hypothetical protein
MGTSLMPVCSFGLKGWMNSQTRRPFVFGGGAEPAVTDGPFSNAKDQIGGFRIIECAGIDEALDGPERLRWTTARLRSARWSASRNAAHSARDPAFLGSRITATVAA